MGGEAGEDSDASDEVRGRKEREVQETLMLATLRDCQDCFAGADYMANLLGDAQNPVSDLGGSRHASAVFARRTYCVVRRKADLLKDAEGRLAGLEEGQAEKEGLAREMYDGSLERLPAKMVGLKPFVAKIVHKDGDTPADGDRTNFERFVQSFGLPRSHQVLNQIRQLTKQAGDWWSATAMQEARAGADGDTIQRFIDAVIDITGEKDYPGLKEVRVILADRFAEKVYELAKRLVARDQMNVERSERPQTESAQEAADGILTAFNECIHLGASGKHPLMEEAKKMETELRKAVVDRKAETVLYSAKRYQLRDQQTAEREAPAIPEVGRAWELADTIEREIRHAVEKLGVPDGHKFLKEAKAVSQELRDEDGQRRRLAAHEKRLQGRGGESEATE